MSFFKKSKSTEAKDPKPADAKAPEAKGASTDKVTASAWKTTERTVRRKFPGPGGATALLRVAVEREAYAELIAHAKESLDREICGVLAGTICEDDEGPFVQVGAVIRGAAAGSGSTHVTFTQQTWNHIHQTLERDFPKLQIVGWYHSHPGFGVEFSEMDVFIQKNFFSGPTQIALVIDPLSGAVAICLNTPNGIQYLERFWVDGREQSCHPPKKSTGAAAPDSPAPAGDTEAALRTIEARLGQLIQSLDEQRSSYYRFLLFIGTIVCVGVVSWIGYSIYSGYRYRIEPPRMNQFVPVPIQVGDKTVLLGVAVAEWRVPDELNALMLTVERERQQAAEKAAKTATNQEPAATSSTNPPAVPKP